MVCGSICLNSMGKLVKFTRNMHKNINHNILVHHGIPSGLNLIGHGFGQHNDINYTPTMTPQIIQGFVDYMTKKKQSGVLELISWPSLSLH